MKTKSSFIIFIFLTLTMSVYGQTVEKKHTQATSQSDEKETLAYKRCQTGCQNCKDNNLIIYDFKRKNLIYNNKIIDNLNKIELMHNLPFKIKIVNINRYYYDIKISTNDISYGSEPPVLFKQLFLGDGDYINNLIAQLSGKETRNMTPKGNFLVALETFMGDYYRLMDININIYEYCTDKLKCCDEKEKLTFSSMAGNLLELKLAYITFNEESTRNLSEIQSKIEDCANKKSKLEDTLKKATDAAKKNAIKEELKSLNCNVLEVEKKGEEQLKADIDKLWQAISKISDTDIVKLILTQNNFVSDHYTYLSPPIFPTGNKLHVGINISPSDSSLIKKWSIMPLYNDSIDFNLFVKGKWFISFSSGPYVGFGKNMRYETFDWQPQPDVNNVISDSSKYMLVSTGNSNIPLGISAFANFGTKLSSNFGLGIATGVGLIIDKQPRPVYMIGIPFYFGDKQQFNISFGASFTQNQKLKSEIYPDLQNALYDNKSTIEYKPTFGYGGFVSISYTLFSIDKIRNTISKSSK